MNKTVGEMTLDETLQQARISYQKDTAFERKLGYVALPIILYLGFFVNYWWLLLLLIYTRKGPTLTEHLNTVEQTYYLIHGHGGSKEEVQEYLDSLDEEEKISNKRQQ